MSYRSSRLDLVRQFLYTNFTVVIVSLLFLASIGGGLMYLTFAETDSEYEEQTVATAGTTSEYQYSASVRERNPVFPVGTELADRTHFFTRVTPVLDGEYTFTYGTDDGDLDATSEVVLLLENTADNEVVWSDEKRLATTGGSDGQTSTTFSINVTALNDRLAAIERDLGTSPRHIDIAVVARTTLSGELAGQRVSETFVDELSIVPQDETYRVISGPGPDSQMEITEPRPVESSSGIFQKLGPVLLFVLSTGASVGLTIAKRSGRLGERSDSEPSLRFERHRRVYDDWISRGTVPSNQRTPGVEMETLEDLVDVAIDSDSRVVGDVRNGNYYVLGEDLSYVFEPPAVETDEEQADRSGAGDAKSNSSEE